MNKLSRFLVKLIFIIIVYVLLFFIFKITKLHFTLIMLLFVFLSNTWKYSLFEITLNEIDDYYALFNLNQNFSKKELEDSYNLELEKMNDFSITAENKISLIAFINTAYDTLSNDISKNEYDLKYNSLLEEIKNQESSLKLDNNVSSYFKGLLDYNLKPFKNFKFFSKNTIGIIACLIIDLLFILPYLSK